MNLTIYITDSLFAVEIKSKENLVFREICEKNRFVKLMDELTMPETYSVKSSVVGLSEYMKIGKLKYMTPTDITQVDKLDLFAAFDGHLGNKKKVLPKIISYNLFLLGIITGIIIMNSLVIQDMLNTREMRLASARAIIEFNYKYGGNRIDGTWLYAEFAAAYNPFRIELFRINVDGTVEIMFLHESPSLNLMHMNRLFGVYLNRGGVVTVYDMVLYLYRIGGHL